MNLHRVKLAALAVCAVMAVSIPWAATTAPVANAAEGCAYDVANLHYRYFEADHAKNLDWWGQSEKATSNLPALLKSVSSGSDLDCFKTVGGFGGSRLEYQLANSDLCLNIAGNSHAVDAHAILYACNTNPINELFTVDDAGTGDGGISIRSASSGLCIDITGGYKSGASLVQKTCVYGDLSQSWHVTG